MIGNWKGMSTPLEYVDHYNKYYNYCMSMLDGEESTSPHKKHKVGNNNACEGGGGGGGVVQNN